MCRFIRCVFYFSRTLLLLAFISHTIIAQTNQNSPFSPSSQNPGSDPEAPRNVQFGAKTDGSYGNSENKNIDPAKSPFTPPPSAVSNPEKNFRPKSAVPRLSVEVNKLRDLQGISHEPPAEQKNHRSSSDVTSSPKGKARGVLNSDAPKPVGSPFRPPMQAEWREGKRPKAPFHPLQEPAHPQNIRPSLSPPMAGGNPRRSQRREPGQGWPRNNANQDSLGRDMHEAAPGVTQWTRYTPRPKVRAQEEPTDTRTGLCGTSRYSPRTQICCQGQVQRRHGMKPSCCGRQSFDSAYSKCCNGEISVRTSQQTECP